LPASDHSAFKVKISIFMIRNLIFHNLLGFEGISSVVATVCAIDDLEALKARVQRETTLPDFVEIRLDELGKDAPTPEELVDCLPCATLVTARRRDEGGAWDLSAEERLEKLLPWLGKAEAVDVELRTLVEESAFADFTKRAADLGTATVASSHDFTATPSADYLRALVERAHAQGAKVAKIAALTSNWEELTRLGDLVAYPPVDLPVSAMGMGQLGKISRPLLAKLGSVLNYGYPLCPNANGQWPDQELKEIIGKI
jgi:3-dehydroquinate dehydratase I